MVRAAWSKNTLIALVMHGRCAGQDIVNVHHFEVTDAREALLVSDALAIVQAGTLVDDWVANLRATFLAMQSSSYTLPLVTAQVVERPGNLDHRLTVVERSQSGPPPGTIAAGTEALATAGVIRWKTDIAGKRHRGRTYVGPVPNDLAPAGVLSSGMQTVMGTYATALRARYPVGTTNAGGSQFTVYSKPFDREQWVKRVGGLLEVQNSFDYAGNSTLVTGHFVDPIARQQRKREIGVGS